MQSASRGFWGAYRGIADCRDAGAARRDLFGYIEGYYNRQRIHSAIGYITPDQAEAKSA